ncbi:hypothetical protein [Aquimarina sp. MMG016]|uniref:hypothetical protein n=1 Tax=Aquimarina sp. MMG016 TaxID=2822690 RepID=UPI001B39F432|nr:hypothetical protein [Aquimarina sp. MMG016]MBQ4821373.1 hypothetical protein [Aquimarina sp. MMG016]
MNTYPEHKLVQQCILEIEVKLDWGDAKLWHNDVFIELSQIIQQQTQVLLSPTTLKRVWGRVTYNNTPSISTLNTLSQFAGYDNWRDFKNKNEVKKPSWIEKRVLQHTGIIITAAAFMTLVFISFYSMIGSGKNKIEAIDLSKVTFNSRPITDGLPNSVIFDFDLKGIQSDSTYIQQYWDITKTIKIKPSQKQATGIYYFPGYFGAKLLVDGKVIKEHDLFITSNDWIGTVDYQPVPKYVQSRDIQTGNLSMPSAILEEITSLSDPVVSTFHLVKDFNEVAGDHISIKTTLRNVYRDKWAVCQKLKIVVLGTEGVLVVPFSIPGCVSDINLMLNDRYYRGKEHDLSAFGVDLSEFKTVDIRVNKKIVTIFINDQEIYSGSYNRSIGNLVGIRYKFLGAGEVKYLNIKNESNENIILQEDFNINNNL